MKRIFLRRFLIVWHGVLFFGVLSALLFSCGEGIRLFPFLSSVNTHKPVTEWKDGREGEYQKNFHRFENRQGNQQTKFQRYNPHQFIDAVFGYSLSLAAVERQRTPFSGTARNFPICLLSENLSSRAPPFSV